MVGRCLAYWVGVFSWNTNGMSWCTGLESPIEKLPKYALHWLDVSGA